MLARGFKNKCELLDQVDLDSLGCGILNRENDSVIRTT